MANPFSPQQPAQPEYFAGRKYETSYFREVTLDSAKLKPPSPVNYAILGTWGLGKTSLLYELKQIALQDLSKEIKCACIHLPLSPNSCRDWDTFTVDLLNTAKSETDATKKIQSKITSETNKWQVSLNFGVVGLQRSNQASEKTPNVLVSLRNLWQRHLKPSGVEIAFIFLDDFHYFPIRAEESSYLNVRSLFQELVNQKCNYSLVVSAPTALFIKLAEFAEPVLRFFTRFDLKPFDFEEAKEAIDKRLKVAGLNLDIDDNVVRQIVEETGGHPYILMYSMFELLMKLKRQRRVELQSFEKEWPVVKESLGRTIFSKKFEAAPERERELLLRIGSLEQKEFSPNDLSNKKGTTELLSRLEDRDLLVKLGRGKYTLFHPLFAEYLKSRS